MHNTAIEPPIAPPSEKALPINKSTYEYKGVPSSETESCASNGLFIIKTPAKLKTNYIMSNLVIFSLSTKCARIVAQIGKVLNMHVDIERGMYFNAATLP